MAVRKQHLQQEILENLSFDAEPEDAKILDVIDDCLQRASKESYMSLRDMLTLRRELYHGFRKLDLLSELLEDDTITEIMINGYQNIFVERKGRIEKIARSFASEEKLWDVIQQIVAGSNRMVNETHPIVDCMLADGSRVNVVLPPISKAGAIMTIRRFPEIPITMDTLITYGSVTKEAVEVLKLLVEAGYNIFISGGTGSGKTTFLNALSGYVPKDERIITIEDSAELRIQGAENLVRLEARQANVEGENAISIQDLIKASLRMRPDRIIVGEVRDGAALDMLTAMSTGHDGSLSTGHGNSAKDMLRRLETMVLMAAELPLSAIQGQIASAIDIVVQLGRLRDGSRRVLEICELTGVSGGEYSMNVLYEFEENEDLAGNFKRKHPLQNVEKLKREGLYEAYCKLM